MSASSLPPSPVLRPGPRADATVSVAMATYNGARFLAEQLDSLAAQTVKPSEIVVCDDGSTDATMEVVARFAARAPVPVRLERNPQTLGYADNFLKAASLTSRPYIAFCDQDDVWRADKIERSLAAIREAGAAMAVHTATLIDADGRPTGILRRHIDATRAFPPCTLDPWTLFGSFSQVVDRRLLDLMPSDRATRGRDINTPDGLLGHDGWTSFLAGSFGTVAAIDEPLVSYRQHDANVFGVLDGTTLGERRAEVADERSRLERVAFLADIALHRLTVLEMHGGGDPRFAAPIAHWKRVYRHCVARRDLHTHERVLGRAGRLAANLARGTYRHPSRGGLGLDRLVEDATLGMFKRPGRA